MKYKKYGSVNLIYRAILSHSTFNNSLTFFFEKFILLFLSCSFKKLMYKYKYFFLILFFSCKLTIAKAGKNLFISHKRKLLLAVFYLAAIWNFSIEAISLTENTPYQSLCEQAATNDNVFADFKRHPHYQQCLEHVSYESGGEYLDFIVQKDPDLVLLFDKFRENDSIGHPVIFDYGKYGWFSPTTLRYIKVACDLKQQFSDLSKMHIVEIGGGYGGQCKILAELTGFASYTIIDLPEALALTKKYLSLLGIQNVHFIENTNLSQVGSYDLVISNYAFSEIDRSEQQEYLEQVINPTKNGYMTMNFISPHLQSISIDDLILGLYLNNRKGNVEKEHPNTGPKNLIIIWKPTDSPTLNKRRDFSPASSGLENGNAITYGLSGGRLGDNLVSYFHAKWLSYKYNLLFRYLPFPYADQFFLSDEDQPLGSSAEFRNTIPTASEADITAMPNSSLFVIPYFPDVTEYLYDQGKCRMLIPCFQVDWENPEFHAVVKRCLTPKNSELLTTNLPTDQITVGVHVRRGGGHDSPSMHFHVPLKFPPDSFYIQQIERISKIFQGYPLYVYILTDDLNPSSIAKKFQIALNNPNIHFDYRKEKNGPSINVLEDFFLIPQFDCLIIPLSNFSLIASKIADHAVVITPVHPTFVKKEVIIDEVKLTFNSKRLLQGRKHARTIEK